jgi:predicted DsbA family dithiol-disulfide isomerase
VLTLFHDYTSPASAVAVRRVQRLADEGLAVEIVGFDAIGVDVGLPVTLDVKAAVMALAEEATAEGLALCEPSRLPPTARAHVMEELAESAGFGASWRQLCYRAFWQHDADLADERVLVVLGLNAGLARDAIEAVLADRTKLVAVRRRSAARRADGVGGVPMVLAHRTLAPGLLSEADLRALAVLG